MSITTTRQQDNKTTIKKNDYKGCRIVPTKCT